MVKTIAMIVMLVCIMFGTSYCYSNESSLERDGAQDISRVHESIGNFQLTGREISESEMELKRMIKVTTPLMSIFLVNGRVRRASEPRSQVRQQNNPFAFYDRIYGFGDLTSASSYGGSNYGSCCDEYILPLIALAALSGLLLFLLILASTTTAAGRRKKRDYRDVGNSISFALFL